MQRGYRNQSGLIIVLNLVSLHHRLLMLTLFSAADSSVYCYKRINTTPFIGWMNCQGHGTNHKVSIEARFGVGVPSSVDTAFASGGHSSWTFYFIKAGYIYKSVPGVDNDHHELVTGYPKLLHEEFPKIPCGIVTVTDGQNAGTFVVFKGTKHYQIMNGNSLDEKGTMCAKL